MKLTLLQKILSNFYPVRIATAEGKTTPVLALYRFAGRWQLGSATALYSDGAAYRPLTTAFAYLKPELARVQSLLTLGAGLGSAVDVLHKMGVHPKATLIDIDPQVIQWGQELQQHELKKSATWIEADVEQFAASHTQVYDLIVLDIFQDRIVPHFVTSPLFLAQCQKLMADKKSILVLNYIVNNSENWELAQSEIKRIFTIEHIISIGINRILILRNNV